MSLARMSLIVVSVLGAGCPGKSSKKGPEGPVAKTCDDVAATAVQLDVQSALPALRPTIARRVTPSTLFGQEAPPPEPPPAGIMVQPPPEEEQDVGAIWRDECVRFAWSAEQIDCFTSATTNDAARACAQGAAPVAEDDPACVAAAEHGAEILANDIGVTGADREDVLSRAIPAILEPCREQRFSDELLECLTDPEMIDSFGICAFADGEGWERLKVSLTAQGFGPGE